MARTKSPDSKLPVGVVMLRPQHYVYLSLWAQSVNDGRYNPSEAIEELVDRCVKVWPGGPNAGPARVPGRKPAAPRPRKAVQEYATAHNLTYRDAETQLIRLALKSQQK